MRLSLLTKATKSCRVPEPRRTSETLQLAHITRHAFSMSKTSFIETYLQQDLDDFRAKFVSLLNISPQSSNYPFSIQSEVEVDILDVINSGMFFVSLFRECWCWHT